MKNFDNIFFCISAYSGDFEILNYAKEYKVYVKDNSKLSGIPSDAIYIKNHGYNLYAYLLFIIENYYNLPEKILFTKNNIFPRHLSRDRFISLLERQSRYMFDAKSCIYRQPFAFIDIDGKFAELNNSWYTRNAQCKFFGSLNKFLEHFFDFIDYPVYVKYPPGGNIMVGKNDILCRPREFYRSLIKCIDYKENAPESYFIERSLDIIFDENVKINGTFLKCFPAATEGSINTVKHFSQKAFLPLLLGNANHKGST